MIQTINLNGPNKNTGQSLTRFEAGVFKSMLEQMDINDENDRHELDVNGSNL